MAKKKKLFISVPMRDRKPGQIRYSIKKFQHIAEAIWEQEFDVISGYYISEVPPDWCKNESIYHLGDAIKHISECDYYIGVEWPNGLYRGCTIENDVAREYDITRFFVPLQGVLMPEELDKVLGKTIPNCSFQEVIMRDIVFIVIGLLIVFGFVLYLKGWNDGFDDGEAFEKEKRPTPYLNDLMAKEKEE